MYNDSRFLYFIDICLRFTKFSCGKDLRACLAIIGYNKYFDVHKTHTRVCVFIFKVYICILNGKIINITIYIYFID